VSGNSIYISVGLTIIAALVVALIGPLFIDWNAYKPTFERAASRVLGAPVAIQGDISARLLPTPLLDVAGIVVGDLGNPVLRVSHYRMQLDISPLLKGELKVAELRLDQPQLFVGVDDAGRLDIGAVAPNSAALARELPGLTVENAEIRDGAFDFRDARTGRKLRIDGVNASASLAAAGPFKLEGDGHLGDRAIGVKLSASKRGDSGAWPVKLLLSAPADQTQLALDLGFDTAGPLRATGSLVAQRLAETGKGDRADRGAPPWRLDAKLDGRSEAIQFSDVALTVGPDDRALTLTGRGSVTLGGTPRYDLALSGRQLDLDRLFPPRPGVAVDQGEAIRRTLGLIAAVNRFDIDGRLALDVPSVMLGGSLAQDLKLVLRPRLDTVAIDTLDLRLPGRSRLSARGQLTTGNTVATAAARPGSFSGTATLASEQPQLLAAWLRRDRVGGLVPAFTLSGRVTIDGDAGRLDDATLALGNATVTGGVAVTSPADRPRSIAARVRAEALDLDRLQAFADLLGIAGESAGNALGSAALDLDVGTLTAGDVAARGVTAKLKLDGDTLTVDQLSVSDADGAALTVSGGIERLFTSPEGRLKGSLRAERSEGLQRLAARLAPGAGESWKKLAGNFAPLAADLDVRADAASQTSTVDIAATAADTRVTLNLQAKGSPERWRDAAMTARATLEATDARALARQIGLTPTTPAAAPPRPLRLEASASGPAGGDVKLAASLRLGEGTIGFTGAGRLAEDAPRLTGDVTAALPDVPGIADLLGIALSAPAQPVAAKVSAKLALADGATTLNALAGQIGTSVIDGGVTLSTAPAALTGRLNTTSLDIAPLAEALFGRGAFTAPKVKPSDIWPSARLAGPLAIALPIDLAVSAGKLTLDPDRALDKASFRFGVADGEARVDDLSASLGGGKVAGRLGVRRGPLGDLALEGALSLDKVRLADTPWRRSLADIANGALDADMTLTAEGGSIPALLQGSAGGGRFGLDRAELRALDPAAFSAVASLIDQGGDAREDRLRAAAQPKLDSGTLAGGRLAGSFSLAAGIVRVRDAVAEAPGARATATATLDLNQWTLDGAINLAGPANLAAANGTQPRLGVTFKGPLDKPERRVDLSQLVTWATTRVVERETARAEQARLEAEARAKREEEARLKREEEARVKREEEARLKREEEARRAAAQQPPTPAPAPAVPAPMPPPRPPVVAPPVATTAPPPIPAPRPPVATPAAPIPAAPIPPAPITPPAAAVPTPKPVAPPPTASAPLPLPPLGPIQTITPTPDAPNAPLDIMPRAAR
jgi:uncharacterized protein involved in outer membrane biogenesis